MKIGKVKESVLKRAVLKQIKNRREEMVIGPAYGGDSTILSIGSLYNLILTVNPITGTPEMMGTYGAQLAANSIAASGGTPVGILVDIMLPEDCEEAVLRQIMKAMEASCKKLAMSVLGGHTEVTTAVNRPIISVTGVGKVDKNQNKNWSHMEPGQELVMTKWAGIYGTAMLADQKEEELHTRYPSDFLEKAKALKDSISILPEIRAISKCKICAIHDLSRGGVFGGLWEMAAGSGVGIAVDLNRIPLKQETVEISEFFEINPYALMSAGSLLLAAEHGMDVVRSLEKEGIPAVIIGKVTEGNDRIVYNEDEERYLEPPTGDELNKILE